MEKVGGGRGWGQGEDVGWRRHSLGTKWGQRKDVG